MRVSPSARQNTLHLMTMARKMMLAPLLRMVSTSSAFRTVQLTGALAAMVVTARSQAARRPGTSGRSTLMVAPMVWKNLRINQSVAEKAKTPCSPTPRAHPASATTQKLQSAKETVTRASALWADSASRTALQISFGAAACASPRTLFAHRDLSTFPSWMGNRSLTS
jgi:hypothetical protein